MNTLSKLGIATLFAISINATAIAGDSNPAPTGDGPRTMSTKGPGKAPKIGGKYAKRLREEGASKGSSKGTNKRRSGNIGGRSPARQKSSPNGKD